VIDRFNLKDVENLTDSTIVTCDYCHKTLDDLVVETMYDHENQNWNAERINLNCDLKGTLYALDNRGNRDRRLVEDKDGRNSNLNQVLNHMGWWGIRLWYNESDGDLHSMTADHDGAGSYTYRELVRFFEDPGRYDTEEFNEYADDSVEFFERMLADREKRDWAIQKFTRPVGPLVAEIYGWPVPEATLANATP